MSILSGMEKQKQYKNIDGDDKLPISTWTSSDTVERPNNITNKDKIDANATTLDHSYDNDNSVPLRLTEFITKTTAFFNNVRYIKKVIIGFSGTDGTNTVTETVQAMYDKIYPVGCLYWSSNPANPSTLFGGTWVQVKDKFIMAAGDTYQAGGTGGNASYTPAGVVGSRSITLQEANIPSHRHGVGAISTSTGTGGGHSHRYDYPNWHDHAEGNGAKISTGGPGSYTTYAVRDNGAHSHSFSVPAHNTGYTGSGTAFSHDHSFTGTQVTILPPYIAYYCWERRG